MMLQAQLTVLPACQEGTGCEIPDTIQVYENGDPIGMILTDSFSRHLTEMTVSGNRIFFAGTEMIPMPTGRPREFELHWTVFKVSNHTLSRESQRAYFLGKYKDDRIEFPVYFKGHGLEVWATLEEHGKLGMATTLMMYGEKEFDEFISAFRRMVKRRPKLSPFSIQAIIDGI